MSSETSNDSAQLFELFYDIALDPIRYEELLDAWERAFSDVRVGENPRKTLADVGLERHVQRADSIMDAADRDASQDERERLLEAFYNLPILVIEPDLTVSSINPLALKLFDLDAEVTASDVDLNDWPEICEAVTQHFNNDKPVIAVRLSLQNAQSALVVLERRGSETPFILMTAAELTWSETIDRTLAEVGGLTPTELSIVRGLVEGASVKKIAAQRGRSVETVRTQVRQILSKTDVRSQTELVRLCAAIAQIAAHTNEAAESAPARYEMNKTAEVTFGVIERPSARRCDYVEFGDPDGMPLIWLHQDLGLTRWPKSVEVEATRRGIRVVAPIRPGFGHSTEPPPDADYPRLVSDDLAALMDTLDIDRAAILSQAGASVFAFAFGTYYPDRTSAIFAAAGALPYNRAIQFERMQKWHRFIIANANFAPRILPFMVKSGFVLARSIGHRRFGHAMFAKSPADLAVINTPELMDALLLGSETVLFDNDSAHAAFTREALEGARDWSDHVRACRDISVTIFAGDTDPQIPLETYREWEADWPWIDYDYVDNAGQFVFFSHPEHVLDAVGAHLEISSKS